MRTEQLDEFKRLARTLIHGPPFQIVFVDCGDEVARGELIAALDEVTKLASLRSSKLPIGSRVEDAAGLERRLRLQAISSHVVHVINGPSWFDAHRWADFNQRRERLSKDARARLVFWLNEAQLRELPTCAADLWAWRSGVYTFDVEPQVDASSEEDGKAVRLPIAFDLFVRGIDTRSDDEKRGRLVEISATLALTAVDEQMRPPLLDELVELHIEFGELDEALGLLRNHQLPAYEAQRDLRSLALTTIRIGDVLLRQGRLEEALRTYRQEALPLFDEVQDVRSRAATMGRVADTLRMLGRLDEALGLYSKEVLPVFERLGDARAQAMSSGAVAAVLEAQGRHDEALRLYRQQVLPCAEELGDLRLRAAAMSGIADVLQARGQLDESLRIRQSEELPAYERLGDARARARTMGRIADAMQARGQLDESVRIRRDEELPAIDSLLDKRNRAIAKGELADQLQSRGQYLDTVLSIRRKQELPIYEDIGDLRARTNVLLKLASSLKIRGRLGDHEEARQLLGQAMEHARELKWPEAQRRAKLLLDALGPG